MTEVTPSSRKFGSFVFDTERLVLTEGGEPVPLKRQSASVLALLVKNARSVVTRDEIRDHVWHGRTIEYDDGINACIRDIRRALGDSTPDARFIETLPKVGYRFMVEPERPVRRRGVRSRMLVPAAILAVVVAGLANFAIWQSASEPPPVTAEQRIAVMPFRAAEAHALQAEALTARLVAALVENQTSMKVISAGELFEGREPGMGDVSRWLEVEHLVAGQVFVEDGQTMLNLRLIRTDGYVHLWSKTVPLSAPLDEAALEAIVAEMTAAGAPAD